MCQWWDEYPVFDFARNARCTVTTDLLVWYSNTQNDFSPGAAIFTLHTLASPSGRNVNYDEKQLTAKKKIFGLFLLFVQFRKYVSYGFPIINFWKPGVHYETPCIWRPIKYGLVSRKDVQRAIFGTRAVRLVSLLCTSSHIGWTDIDRKVKKK